MIGKAVQVGEDVTLMMEKLACSAYSSVMPDKADKVCVWGGSSRFSHYVSFR